MPYIDKIQVGGTDYDIQDTKAQTEVDELESALSNEITRATTEEGRIEALFTAPTQEAVNTWLNAHPEATTTVQDSSLTLEKFTSETKKILTNVINVVNSSNYSVDGSNRGNQAPAINSIIESCESGDTVYLPNGAYRITEPIIINKSINFICDGAIRAVLDNSNYAIIISEPYVNFHAHKIEATNGNSGCIQIYSSSKVVQYVNIDIDEIAASSSQQHDSINITADEYSVYYCTIKGKRFYGSLDANCISIKKISQTATVGNITIYDVLINHYNNAIHSSDENYVATNGGNVNSILCKNISLDGNNNGFYFKDNRSPYIMDCRIAEQQQTSLLTFNGTVVSGGLIGRTPIKLINIKWINPAIYGFDIWYKAFCIYAPCYFQDSDSATKMFALLHNGKIYTEPLSELAEYTIS